VDGYDINYFDWLGAAMYAADSRTGSMHGRQAFFESVYAGIDEANLYSRIDFADALPEGELRLVIQCGTRLEKQTAVTGSGEPKGAAPEARRTPIEERVLRFEITVRDGKLKDWNVFDYSPAEIAKRALRSSKQTASSGTARASAKSPSGVEVALARILELKLPLSMLRATQGQSISLRFTLWRQGLPLDALPVDGSMDLEIASEEQLASNVYNHSPAV
jgi:hypothetical protein